MGDEQMTDLEKLVAKAKAVRLAELEEQLRIVTEFAQLLAKLTKENEEQSP
jgi:hypothetical protein